MIFATFSWGEYSQVNKSKTVESVTGNGHSILWKELPGLDWSCAKGRNSVCADAVSSLPLDETFMLMDRDMFLYDFEYEPCIPFGVIGVYGRSKDVDSVTGEELYGDRRDRYIVPDGHVDASKGISSALAMSSRTYKYIGGWNEDYVYSRDFWGMEDSEWIIRARMKGCEFVRLHGMKFGHFDHWLSDDKVGDLMRRLGNSIRQFELEYGFAWKDFCEVQSNVKEFVDGSV